MTTVFRNTALSMVLVLSGSTAIFAQSEQTDDVVAAAKKARSTKAVRAKAVVTDEDMPAKPTFEDLNLNDPKGAASILTSVEQFKATHSPEETEAAVRSWFQQNEDKIESLLSQVKSLTDAERTKSEEKGEPASEIVKRSDDLQEQLRRVLDALKSKDDRKDSNAHGLPLK